MTRFSKLITVVKGVWRWIDWHQEGCFWLNIIITDVPYFSALIIGEGQDIYGGHLWHVVKGDTKSYSMCLDDAQVLNKWRRTIKGQLAKPGSHGKQPSKRSCQDIKRARNTAHMIPVLPSYADRRRFPHRQWRLARAQTLAVLWADKS